MTAPVRDGTSPRRSLSVRQAIGLPVSPATPSMAADGNPQGVTNGLPELDLGDLEGESEVVGG